MSYEMIEKKAERYFSEKLNQYIVGPGVADCNSLEAQEIRYEQVIKVLPPERETPFSVCDFGCGLGDLKPYLQKRYTQFEYYGIDVSEEIIKRAKEIHGMGFLCGTKITDQYDYIVSSGIFNNVLDNDKKEWERYFLDTLTMFHDHARKGFSFNALTKYSDVDRMRDDLFYADPCFLFDYCKTHFSRNVALLHDYDIYDFTIIVKKV